MKYVLLVSFFRRRNWVLGEMSFHALMNRAKPQVQALNRTSPSAETPQTRPQPRAYTPPPPPRWWWQWNSVSQTESESRINSAQGQWLLGSRWKRFSARVCAHSFRLLPSISVTLRIPLTHKSCFRHSSMSALQTFFFIVWLSLLA